MTPDILTTAEEINAMFEVFYGSVNPVINFGNTTSRRAASLLIDKFGLEKALAIARYAVQVQGKKYAPAITTPYQLKEKLAMLVLYAKREKHPKIISI